MDEFFDFEGATHENAWDQQQPAYPDDAFHNFDMNLALAEPGRDEDAFLCLAHFTKEAPDQQISFDLHSAAADRSRFISDASGFPSWIDDRDFMPQESCTYCAVKGFHCRIIKAGAHKGSCTSCVALERECSRVISETVGDGDEEDDVDLGDGAVPKTSPPDGVAILSAHSSASDLQVLRAMEEDSATTNTPLKSGTRFSRESLRILRGWLTAHHRLPYPTDEDKEDLKKQTGLSKTQISNWIANARRRGKVRPPRTVSPAPNRISSPVNIRARRGTPIPREMEEMNPLERWENSPPEHEPASVAAIASAISSGGLIASESSPDFRNGDSDSAARSLCNVSSTSGFGTSGSSGDSFASAFSYDSRNSFGSFAAKGRRRRGQRRERKKSIQPFAAISALAAPRKFQCTFCTETFKTKHDWHRHEKSLHLSLERWICAPHGPTSLSDEKNDRVCAFCGDTAPNESHFEHHNYAACADRTLEERTFYRKDHLRQHLLLMHDIKFDSSFMNSWRVETPQIKSRCGFCDMTMETWTFRVDHLAKHFKAGKNMSEWQGDWGFEPHVLAIVENAMPPYLIHYDRNTPRPYRASRENPESMRQPYDLVKMGLVDFINEKVANAGAPTDNDLLLEARQIYKSLDGAAKGKQYRGVSWLRDLFMAGTQHIGPKNLDCGNLIGSQSSSEYGIGRCCPNETKLKDFVLARIAIASPPTTAELQNEACTILAEAEQTSTFPCETALAWFTHLIMSSGDWLEDFRQRVDLPLKIDLVPSESRVAGTADHGVYSSSHLERGLTDYFNLCTALGAPQPSDEDLQRQGRIIIFGTDNPQVKTLADDRAWLDQFKYRYRHATRAAEQRFEDPLPIASDQISPPDLPDQNSTPDMCFSPSPRDNRVLHWDISPSPAPGTPGPDQAIGKKNTFNPMANSLAPFARLALPLYPQNMAFEGGITNPTLNPSPNYQAPNTGDESRRYFFSDANCYRRLMYELSRFVASCMSQNNPNPHFPTDEEIQRQARWILYDDDDPWNQTAADNEEWLNRFKRDVGMLGKETNTGLGLQGMTPWLPTSAFGGG